MDLEILRLVNDRASVAGEIGRVKTESGEEVFSPAREEEVLQNVVAVNEKSGGLAPAKSVSELSSARS